MRAIILSAGQGRRLLPLTAETPKCLLEIDGARSLLELQLDALARCGIRSATVMVGFGAEKVEEFLASRPVPKIEVQTRYNPFFAATDNLVTCWLARNDMTRDFILLNGDTIVQTEVVRRIVAFKGPGVAVVIDRKAEYSDDDMKVTLDGGTRLRAVGKSIPAADVDGESIGLIAFRGWGVEAFRDTLDQAVRNPASLNKWYLHVINTMAGSMPVQTVSIEGLWWAEVDSRADLEDARRALERQSRRRSIPAATAAATQSFA